MYFLKIIVLCSVFIFETRAGQLPSFIQPCSRSQPLEQLSECITAQARNAQPYFVKGLPELGIEPLDPLTLGDVTANAGTFIIKSTNVILKGLKKMEIREMVWDLEKKIANMKLFGNLTFLSDYETDGRILLIPINGHGKLTVKTYNTDVLIKYKLRTGKDANGVEHIETYDLKPSQSFQNVKIHMSNILGGAAGIGDTVNQVLNDNWRDLMKELGPPFMTAVATKVHEAVNKLYSFVPYDEIILP